MAGTPIVDPPLVTDGDLRLLIHEAAMSAVLKGLRHAKPQDFIFGSFDLPNNEDLEDPIEIPTPNDGPLLKIHWRIDLATVSIDLPPSSVVEEGFANPFTLREGEAGIYTRLILVFASEDLTTWRETIEILAWLLCKMQPLSDGDLFFTLEEIQVRIPDIANSAVLNLANLVLNAYLDTAVPEHKLPVAKALKSDVFTVQLTGTKLMLNTADFAGAVQSAEKDHA